MREYDPSKPLIFTHIPKTAGTSLRVVFEQWFGDLCYRHYRDGPELPPKVELEGRPLVLYGHFNGALGFGIGDYYPEVSQCITVMREPFARVVSGYFYSRRAGTYSGTISEFVLSYPSNPGGILNYFPRRVTHGNYKELIERYFIDIGTTERLPESVARFAEKLGKKAVSVPTVNVSEYTHRIPEDLRGCFRDRNRLEHEVYEYVQSLQV